MRYDAFIRVMWCIHMCDTTHSCVRHMSVSFRQWISGPFCAGIFTRSAREKTYLLMWCDAWPCVAWLVCTCSTMAHSHVCHDSRSWRWMNRPFCAGIFTRSTHDICVWYGAFIRAMWSIYKCDTAHLYVRHRPVWSTRDMMHAYVWPDAFPFVTRRIHTCDMTPSYVRYDSCSWR